MLDAELQDSYSGPCVDGLAEGRGTARGLAAYEGGFRKGRKDGKGVETWANGDRYEGDFVAGQREGRGVYAYGRGPWEGERYEGEWASGLRNGIGTYRYASGDVYTGPWKDGVATGAPTGMMLARARFEEEALAAVGKTGTKVCRELALGNGGREWQRGVVEAVEGKRVGVRVGEEIVWGEATQWTPCF